MRVFLGRHEVKTDSPYRQNIVSTLERAWSLAQWQSVDGVEIKLENKTNLNLTFSGKKKRKPQKTTTEKSNCQPSSANRIFCPIENFGGVYLLAE